MLLSGTGKTTVAKLYGQILAAIGILRKGDNVVITTPAECTGQYLGATIHLVRKKFKEAQDGVLVFDEAHNANPYGMDADAGRGSGAHKFKEEFINALISNVPGDMMPDTVVILAGYKGPMANLMLADVGLPRRFPTVFHFQDYTTNELGQIFDAIMLKNGEEISPEVREAVLNVLRGRKKDENFGNGGAVNILINEMNDKRQARAEGVVPYEVEDVPKSDVAHSDDSEHESSDSEITVFRSRL